MTASDALSLQPEEILVISNRNASDSTALAQYYMKQRGIPKDQLLKLWVTDKEWCTREDYEGKVLSPVRKYLEKNAAKGIRCVVTMLGLPLRVDPRALTKQEEKDLKELREKHKVLYERLRGLAEKGTEESKSLGKEVDRLKEEMARIAKKNQRSALDSELALALVEKYDLAGWVPNPLFLGYGGKPLRNMPQKDRVLMVSRLDGPSADTVRRMIGESIEAEKRGLEGTAYFDARWPRPTEEKRKKGLEGYGFYDASIYLAADRVAKMPRMKLVLNDKPELFQPGDCPNAALYCGWYSHHQYVDAFEWLPGSVGYHIASSECGTLRAGKSQVWCKRMLEEGVAATLGPVGEPYLQSFPVPEIFFGLLVDGRLTLSECYMLSLPFLSWQIVLVGDPLYRPFGKGPGDSP
ncbi:MAG: TIGR03790 family protein [Desulfobacterales bacterium]